MNSKAKVIISSHGYNGSKNNRPNQTYAYLARFLPQEGFCVTSIQHEPADDPLLAMEGNFMGTRMPSWEGRVTNILFTIQRFKKLKPQLNWNDFILIGHSNGGGMTMLFTTRYPQLINKTISMGHRRIVMSRTRNSRLYTLRGHDYDTDSGVLPTEEEQEQFRMKVVKLDGIAHSNMGENGAEGQHDLINQYTYGFPTRRQLMYYVYFIQWF